MFERYTESARRALFFARYETTELGGRAIETEQILLGLVRVGRGLTAHIFNEARLHYEDVVREIEARVPSREKVATSVEIPFSEETQRVLNRAATEADALHHSDIQPEHLLLGLLRESNSVAASILTRHGLTLEAVRERIAQSLAAVGFQVRPDSEGIPAWERIAIIRQQLDELARGANREAAERITLIQKHLDDLQRHLG